MSLAEAAAPSVALVQTSYAQFFAEPLRFLNEHIIIDIHIRISSPLLIEPQIQSVLKLRILSRLYGPYLVQRRGVIRSRQPELFSTHNVTNCVLGDNISEVIKKPKMQVHGIVSSETFFDAGTKLSSRPEKDQHVHAFSEEIERKN